MKLYLVVVVLVGLFVVAVRVAGAQTDATGKQVGKIVVVADPPTSQPVPVTDQDAITKAKEAWDMAKAGKWWLFSASLCSLLMFALKRFDLLEKMGRWKYVVLPVLSAVASTLSGLQGNLHWVLAVGTFLSCWNMASVQQMIKKGILGKVD